MKKLILLSFLLWVGLITGLPETGLSRQKRQSGRANVQGCTMTPSGIDNILTPAKENAIISVTCTTDTAPDSCVFQHAAPMDVGLVSSAGGSAANDQYNTKCTATLQTNGQTCPDDSRITYVMTSTSCGFRISKAEPDDTGRWILTVSEAMASGSMVDNTKTVTIYTFNRTLTDITDDRDSLITRNVDAWFNYDDNEEEWRAGSIGGWEQVELNCNARGGRPEPKIRWYINNDDRNAFGGESGSSDADKVFSVRESYGRTYDDEGYIRDKISQLIFDVDRDLLNYLWEKNQINSNPTTGQFTFDLVCEVNQGEYGMEKISTTITVKRIYFEDRLKTSTIGWIVGGVLVGILLILIILVALWAKASGRWCFEDDEYSYGNPNDPKRRPRTQAQVYSAEDTDSPGPVKAMSYAPTAPSRTKTTLVGQVQGSPAPTPNTQGPLFIKNKNQTKPIHVDSGIDSQTPPSSPSPPILQSTQFRSSSSSASSATQNPSSDRRPKSQYLTELPPRPPSKKRHSYHPTASDNLHHGDVTYADLDPKAFMVPANHVLPPLHDKQAYADIMVSQSKIV